MVEKYLNSRLLIVYVTPFVLGSLTTLSFSPFNLTIINFFIFPLIFFLLCNINKKSKSIYRKRPYKKNFFLFGLLFGFGFYLSGISWITNSLTYDENFKVLIPFALVLLPLFLSLFLAFTFLIIGAHLRFNLSSLIIFIIGIVIADYIRANIFTGFPWNLWAYSTTWASEIIQIINKIGLHTYNLLLTTFFILPISIFFNISLIKKLTIITISCATILGVYIYGNYEINKNKKFLKEIDEKIFVKIISPNFDLEYDLSNIEIEERFKKLIRYSEPEKNKKTLFIWPEGVFSGYSYDEILIFKNLITENFSEKHHIIFGSNTIDLNSGQYFNSMLLVNNNFEIIQRYNKKKLVPFGEFLPFESILKNIGLKKITEGHGSFLQGRNEKNILLNKLKILPLICYEIIFTDLIQKSDNDTNLIINISEDGWFGKTIGPHQHFVKSIYRAIENNTFVLRSANKGLSAIIDNKGNIIKQLNQNEAGNIEFEVPLIKSNKIKNDLIFFILLITYLFIFLIYKKKNAK